MKNILVLILILFSLQTKAQISLGVIGEPTLNIARIGRNPKALSDSFINLKKADISAGLGLEIRKQIDRYQSLSFVPSYYQANMLLYKEDLQFLDTIHPGMTEIRDFSQAAQKNAFVNYRFKYIGLQTIYAQRIQSSNLSNKTFLEVGGGLGLHYLIENDVKVTTEGFAIEEKYNHIITENTGITATEFAVNILGHLDINYEMTPSSKIFAGLKINIPVLTTANSEPTIRIFTPALRCGIRLSL